MSAKHSPPHTYGETSFQIFFPAAHTQAGKSGRPAHPGRPADRCGSEPGGEARCLGPASREGPAGVPTAGVAPGGAASARAVRRLPSCGTDGPQQREDAGAAGMAAGGSGTGPSIARSAARLRSAVELGRCTPASSRQRAWAGKDGPGSRTGGITLTSALWRSGALQQRQHATARVCCALAPNCSNRSPWANGRRSDKRRGGRRRRTTRRGDPSDRLRPPAGGIRGGRQCGIKRPGEQGVAQGRWRRRWARTGVRPGGCRAVLTADATSKAPVRATAVNPNMRAPLQLGRRRCCGNRHGRSRFGASPTSSTEVLSSPGGAEEGGCAQCRVGSWARRPVSGDGLRHGASSARRFGPLDTGDPPLAADTAEATSLGDQVMAPWREREAAHRVRGAGRQSKVGPLPGA